jgi:putative MATE family efflux protein
VESFASEAAFVTGPVRSTLVRLAFPMWIGLILIVSVDVTDALFVSQLGPEPLAGLGFAIPAVLLATGLWLSVGIGVTSSVASAIGSGNAVVARRVAAQSIVIAICLAVALMVIGRYAVDGLFGLLGATAKARQLASEYMAVWLWGMPFLALLMLGTAALRGAGDIASSVKLMFLASIINLVLNPILIFGMGPVAPGGLAGSAAATVFARVACALLALRLLMKRDLLLVRREDWAFVRDTWRRVSSVASPVIATEVMTHSGIALLTRIFAKQGATAVAAYGINVRMEGVLLMIALAISSTITPFVGQNWAASRRDRASEATFFGAGLAFVVVTFGALVASAFARPLARAFGDDDAVIDALTTMFRIMPLSLGGLAVIMVAGAAMNAIDRARHTAAFTLLSSLLLSAPIAWLAGNAFGLAGVLMGPVIARTVTALWAIHRLRGEGFKIRWREASSPSGVSG